MNKETDVVEQELGNVCRYQAFQGFMHLFSTFVHSVTTLAIVFTGYQPEYQCRAVENTTDLTELLAQRNITGSVVATHYEKCSINITVMGTIGNTSHSLPCVNGIQFSMPEHTSFLTEWSLVCDRRGLTELSQTVLMVGMSIGAVFFSSLSDHFGRKKIYISCAVGLLGSTVGYSLAPNYLVFLAFRVLTGALQQGLVMPSFTMYMEVVPLRWRNVGGVIDGFMWAGGGLFLAAIAYGMQGQSWRYLSLALSSVFTYSLILLCFLDESIRWLIATDKWNEANRILIKAKRINGLHTPPTTLNMAKAEKYNLIGSTRDMELLDVIKTEEEMAVRSSEEITELVSKHCPAEKSTCPQVTTELNISPITLNKDICESEDPNNEELVRDDENGSMVVDKSGTQADTALDIKQSDDVTVGEPSLSEHADTNTREKGFKDEISARENTDRENSDVPDTESHSVQVSKTDRTRYKVWDLCRHREVLVPLLVSTFLWISCSLYYYAVMLGSSTWFGNRFLNFAILSALEIPGYLLASFIVPRVNRRPLCVIFGTASAVSALLSACVASLVETDAGQTAATVLGFVGQFFLFGSYSVLFAFIQEVFPTCLRNAGMGVASSMSRFAGMVAPFLVMLGEEYPWAPKTLMGCFCLLAALCTLFLPETRNRKLPDTITAIRAWRTKPVVNNTTAT